MTGGKLALALPLVLIAGCDRAEEAAPRGVSTDEARALDEAAEMLEARSPTDSPSTKVEE